MASYIISTKKDLSIFGDKTDTDMTVLTITAHIEVDLSVLRFYPQLKELNLYGKFSGYENIPSLEYLESLKISGNMTTNRISDLGFIEKIPNLKKLWLESLPSVVTLPALHNIYALKIYELHKIENLETLLGSQLRFLDLCLCADKVPASKIAEILSKIDTLEKVGVVVDRSGKKEQVLRNQLIKLGKKHLIDDDGILYAKNWDNL
ncbi:MAG: hypothetical protein ACI4JZ_06975 [Oscillospiraceae bacterium]